MTKITEIEKIRSQYTEKEITNVEKLKQLDKKVKLPVKVFAYVFGSVSSLVLGTGMCLAMKIIGDGVAFLMPLGIVIGLLGILLVSINYPIYKKILKGRKEKYAKQIIEISDGILNK